MKLALMTTVAALGLAGSANAAAFSYTFDAVLEFIAFDMIYVDDAWVERYIPVGDFTTETERGGAEAFGASFVGHRLEGFLSFPTAEGDSLVDLATCSINGYSCTHGDAAYWSVGDDSVNYGHVGGGDYGFGISFVVGAGGDMSFAHVGDGTLFDEGQAMDYTDGIEAIWRIENVERVEPSPVPLPAALPILAAGLGLLGLVRRRRR